MNKKYVFGAGFSIIFIIAVIIIISNLNSVSNLFAQDSIGASKPPVVISPQVDAMNNAFVAVSEAVLPTVVSINVEIETSAGKNQFQDQFKDFFEFFGMPQDEGEEQGKRRSEGSGSGVIISQNGYIVTNNHVVENAVSIKVKTYDKKEYKAELIGTDPLTDLALIKIDASPLPVAHLADMDNVRIGEWVLAVGNPLGLNSTVTTGIVSAIGRGELSLSRDKDGYSIENFIQTDAAINPGNSGGGLFNLHGSLVGINTAIATRTGTYIGYGFAIPIDLVRSVVLDLMDDGKINRGYIGVSIRTVDEVVAKSLGLDKVEGALVHNILKDSPAEKAGVESGDVILEVDGKKISTSNELQSTIVMKRAGDKVNLTIWRDGKKINKTVKLEPRDKDTEIASATKGDEEKEEVSSSVDFDKLGFTAETLNKDIKENFDVKQGAYVTKVKRYSLAEQRGLVPNGVIIKADRKEIKSPSDLKKIVDSKKSGETILLHLKYKDQTRIVAFEIP
ncbi:MAG TPA: Do family serine endopeptidase [Candidatus Kapabacteria bacterium]|nr:Do family serine endopeptidase [Candidatus Kapabacteria bacterium]